MAKTDKTLGPIAQAVSDKNTIAALEAIALKTAQTLDNCGSTRDIRPLVGALLVTMDRLQQMNPGRGNGPTPLDQILAEAERVLQHAGGNLEDADD